ncbi:MAG: CopG family transcriptional regulator [Methylobacter sp.]|nr:CopG family transcriptional regulator [Methylobacter sp.]
MSELSKKSTVYFDPELHEALKIKSAITHQSLSQVVNEAIRMALQEDREDLSAFEERAGEPTLSYEELLEDLTAHGKL